MTDLQIFIGKTIDDKYYFRVRTAGERVLLTSREYISLEKCMNEVYGIQQYTNFALEEEYDRTYGHRYTLIGSWGRMVAISPNYIHLYGMRDDMAMVRNNVSRATVTDHSALVRFFRRVRIK